MGAPLPQPWTGHRAVVPVDAAFIESIRQGAVVEFSAAPSAEAPRMRGQLIASQIGPEFYWNQFDAQGRNTGSREVRDDEVNDLVHGLVAPELVPNGAAVMDSVADDMARLLAEFAAGSPLDSIRLASELLMAADSESRVHVARDYFRARLQDSTVETVIGPVKIIGGTWKEMRRGMAHDGIKAGLVPLVPTILSSGYLVGGREPDTKHRTDYSAFFFIRMDGIKMGEFIVDAGVTVGERPEGSFEYRLNAYSLGHSQMAKWSKKIAPEAPRGKEPRTSGAMGDGEPFLDDIMGYQPEDCNIVILAIRDAKTPAVLDSASPMDRARIAADITRKVGELQTASGVQRVRIASELAALVSINSVSIYNSDNGTPAAKEPTMETTAPTMDRNETEARALLAAGFKTKAEQKRAREAVTRAFNVPMEAILAVYLSGDRDEAGSEFYYNHPMYPHEWKPKHAEMARAALPAAAVHIEAVERIVRLAADIKAAPMLTTVADEKAAKERAEMATRAMNPELHDEFMAQAPALAAEYDTYMENTYLRLQEVFPDGVPAYIDTRDKEYRHRDSVMMLRSVCDTISKPGPSGIRGYDDIHTLVLDRAALAREAQRYGEQTALQWFYKTNQKLGDLQSPTLIKDRDGYVHVKGERNGQQVELVQQRIINVSPLGKLFHQFPSRIYLNGKFITEEAYYKLFPPAA